MTLAPLLIALGMSQVANPCDVSRRVYTACVGVPVTMWMCAMPAVGSLSYTVDVDGVRQPSAGFLVRYGYNAWGHIEEPNDVAGNGQVQYVSSHQVAMLTAGVHTVTVMYGTGQAVAFPITGTTVATSLTEFDANGNPLVTACPAVSR